LLDSGAHQLFRKAIVECCADGPVLVSESFQQVGLAVSVKIELLHVFGAIISGAQVRYHMMSVVNPVCKATPAANSRTI